MPTSHALHTMWKVRLVDAVPRCGFRDDATLKPAGVALDRADSVDASDQRRQLNLSAEHVQGEELTLRARLDGFVEMQHLEPLSVASITVRPSCLLASIYRRCMNASGSRHGG